MQKSIRVKIGGKDYNLRGENEEMMKLAAAEVSDQLEILKSSKLEEPLATLSLLTALNIAEQKFISQKQMEVDHNFIINELTNMVDYLNKPVSRINSTIGD